MKKIEEKKISRSSTLLGRILIAAGMITNEQLHKILHVQKMESLPIGTLLVAFDFLNHAQLDQALEIQRELRSGIPSKIAYAESKILSIKTKNYIKHADRVMERAKDAKKKIETGNFFKVVVKKEEK